MVRGLTQPFKGMALKSQVNGLANTPYVTILVTANAEATIKLW